MIDRDTSTARPRKRLTAEQRRKQIIGCAREVFIAQGFQGARTKDIAAAAGINEALLYRHFDSKDDLFESAIVQPLEETVAKLVIESGAPPGELDITGEVMVERTRVFVHDLIDVMEEIAPLLGLMVFSDAVNAAAHMDKQVTPFLGRVAGVVESNLGWWPHQNFDPHAMVRLVFGGIWFEVVHARLTGRDLDKPRVAGDVSQILIRGLLAPEGKTES